MQRQDLERMTREQLIAQAERLEIPRPRVLTQPELIDEIIGRTTKNDRERAKARGWLGRARDLLARVVERGLHLPEAARALRKEDDKGWPAPPPPLPTVTLAEIYAAQGHLERALSVLDEVIAREPDHREAHQMRARFAEQAQRGRGRAGTREQEAPSSAGRSSAADARSASAEPPSTQKAPSARPPASERRAPEQAAAGDAPPPEVKTTAATRAAVIPEGDAEAAPPTTASAGLLTMNDETKSAEGEGAPAATAEAPPEPLVVHTLDLEIANTSVTMGGPERSPQSPPGLGGTVIEVIAERALDAAPLAEEAMAATERAEEAVAAEEAIAAEGLAAEGQPAEEPIAAAAVALDEPPLPDRYDVDEIVAIAVDPVTLYFYWEVQATTLAHARSVHPDGGLCVRVAAVTATWEGPAVETRDIRVDALYGDRFLRDIQPGSNLRVSLGWSSSAGFEPFAVGSEVTAPRAVPVETVAQEVARWESEPVVAPFQNPRVDPHATAATGTLSGRSATHGPMARHTPPMASPSTHVAHTWSRGRGHVGPVDTGVEAWGTSPVEAVPPREEEEYDEVLVLDDASAWVEGPGGSSELGRLGAARRMRPMRRRRLIPGVPGRPGVPAPTGWPPGGPAGASELSFGGASELSR